MMNLTFTNDGHRAAAELMTPSADSMLAVVADIFGEIVNHYKASPTPFRTERVKKYGHDKYFGFNAKMCLEAVRNELQASLLSDASVQQSKALRREVKKAVWRMANMAEAEYVFDLFKNNASEALKHIRTQFAAEYVRTARCVLERNGYDLTELDYACTIWMYLCAGGTWKSFESFRGDSSVYAWMKEVCKHCISRYVEDCGYYTLIAPKRDDEDADETREALNTKGGKRVVYFEDCSWAQVADSRSTYDYDFVAEAPDFLSDRIDEMPWEAWEKAFITDSVINEMSVADITEKYGAMVALMQGKSVPFSRAWTDNRNSRMKRDLYAYALAYMHDDHDVLSVYAKKRAALAARSVGCSAA